MKVRIVARSKNDIDRPATDPLPESNAVIWRWTKGHVCWPVFDPDGMFAPKKPFLLIIFNSWLPLPFIAWRRGRWTGYIGFKIYGVDSEHYLDWLPADQVYPGSQAMHPSIRPFAKAQ